MDTPQEVFLQILGQACRRVELDYFPQMEASELLYRVITLEDLYLPLNLEDADPQAEPEEAGPVTSSGVEMEFILRRLREIGWEEKKKTVIVGNPGQGERFLVMDGTVPGMRLLLRGGPGAGKTTFCKRTVLACLEQDYGFFEKYEEENDLVFHRDRFPVLLSCKGVGELTAQQLEEMSFPQLAWQLCALEMGERFSGIREPDFCRLLQQKGNDGLFLILDAWDEILDTGKEAAFLGKLNAFLAQYPRCDLMVTLRHDYAAPGLTLPFDREMRIRELSREDVRTFYKKWCSTLLSADAQRKNDHARLADEILGSMEPQVVSMRKNPLELSLLLTVSKNDGRLPQNKAKLFAEVVQLHIYWSDLKTPGVLSPKSKRMFLAYIATYLTLNQQMTCSREELQSVIAQCRRDLAWRFSQDLSQVAAEDILRDLVRTGLLVTVGDGDRFSFSQSSRSSHRQVQEYLTAYGIREQYAPEALNDLTPLEIFADKYALPAWQEVVLFTALLDNGRLLRQLVRHLLQEGRTTLLLSFVVNGADIPPEDRHAIFDAAFRDGVASRNIADIASLVAGNSSEAMEFADYIYQKFCAAVAEGDVRYGLAKAVIDSAAAVSHGVSPLGLAREILLCPENEVQVMTAVHILSLMARCSYAKLHNVFTPYCTGYKMPRDMIAGIRKLLQSGSCREALLGSIQEAILGGCAGFEDFFTLQGCCRALSRGEDPEQVRLALSMAPVLSPGFQPCREVEERLRLAWLEELEDALAMGDLSKAVFTFPVCAAMGCWDDPKDIWERILELERQSDGAIPAAVAAQIERLEAHKYQILGEKLQELGISETPSVDAIWLESCLWDHSMQKFDPKIYEPWQLERLLELTDGMPQTPERQSFRALLEHALKDA